MYSKLNVNVLWQLVIYSGNNFSKIVNHKMTVNHLFLKYDNMEIINICMLRSPLIKGQMYINNQGYQGINNKFGDNPWFTELACSTIITLETIPVYCTNFSLSTFSSLTASIPNFLIPSANFSVAMASSFISQRNLFSSTVTSSMSRFWAVIYKAELIYSFCDKRFHLFHLL